MNETDVWDPEKDVGTRVPLSYMNKWDTYLNYAVFTGCQGGAPSANTIVHRAQNPTEAVCKYV